MAEQDAGRCFQHYLEGGIVFHCLGPLDHWGDHSEKWPQAPAPEQGADTGRPSVSVSVPLLSDVWVNPDEAYVVGESHDVPVMIRTLEDGTRQVAVWRTMRGSDDVLWLAPKPSPVDDLADALRLTVEYVGTDTLPPLDGWSWYDALRRHRPDLLLGFTLPRVYREGDRIRNEQGTGYNDRVPDEDLRRHLAEPESWPGAHAFTAAVLRLREQERAVDRAQVGPT